MIVLVGFMGAGKTTVGRLLAAKLGVPFTDSDHVIEARAGKPIPRVFADDGEPAFRQLEHEVIAGLLRGEDTVLALGGGAAAHAGTRAVLAAAAVPVVYLRVSYAEAMGRVGGDRGRPMLARADVGAAAPGPRPALRAGGDPHRRRRPPRRRRSPSTSSTRLRR